MGKGRRRVKDKFEDMLRSVGRTKTECVGNGYEELRRKGKKSDALSRSTARTEVLQLAKRTRFEREGRVQQKASRCPSEI